MKSQRGTTYWKWVEASVGGEVTRDGERDAGNMLVSGFVQVLMDFIGRPWVEGGRVRTGGRDRGSEGRSGTGRQEEGIFGERRGWRDAGSLKWGHQSW